MQRSFETKFQVMTTIVTEMSPSKMETTSKGKHPAIQTSKPCSTGDGTTLKTDDASDISIGSTLFGQSPSVYSKTEGKRVILRVSYLTGLPASGISEQSPCRVSIAF
jgi:hypothetical protein